MLLAFLLAQATSFACTFDAALSGQKCLYEGQSEPGNAQDNSQIAAAVGARGCAAAAGRDEALRKDCEKAVAEASLGAACALRMRLADDDGNLTPQASDCVEALRDAIARTSRAATLSGECCTCVAQAKCAVPALQCKKEIGELSPGAALQSCIARSCSDACAFVAPPAAPPPPAKKSSASAPAEKI